ncbi:PD-(D/E)XK nuclease-like domain-containing protein [Salmonella enterica]|nr:exodeoxyribonuclease VIII [Salmonella enterica]
MSDNKEDFALHCPVKNEEARKRLGIKAGFFWATAKKLSVAVSRCIAAMDDKGYDEDDFKKPVRVNFPVVNDLPPEGVFDTEFCNRYEKGGQDGITMVLIPGAVENTAVTSDTVATDIVTDSDDTADNPLPAYAYNVNGELMEDVEKEMSQPVSGLVLPLRYLAQCGTDSVQHQITPERLRELHSLEMDPDNRTGSILLALQNRKVQLEKLDTKNLHSLASYIGKVFPDGKQPQLNDLINFIDAFLSTDYIDRGLLVKEWQKGNRVFYINRTPSGANAGGGIRSDRKMPQTILGLEFEIALGLLARKYEFDIYSLPLEIELKANTIMNAVDDPEWLATRELFVSMPGGLDYSRACVIATVKTTPENLYESPFRHREHLNKVLTETDHTTPDPQVVNIACGRSSLPMPMKGNTSDDEEKPQSAGAMADEPAASETVEQDTTEYHPAPQQVETESSATDDGNQDLREKFSEQLAASHGDFVPGISDPDDPKWVHNDYSPSNEGEKTEVATDSAADTADYVDHSEDFSNQHEPKTSHSEPVTDQNEPEMPQTEPEVSNIVPAPQPEWPTYFEYGRYEGVPNSAYHAADGISSTMLKDARISLMYFYGRYITGTIKRETSDAFTMGSLVHSLILEPAKFDEEYAVFPGIPAGAFTNTDSLKAFIREYNADKPKSEQLKLTGKKEDLQEAIRAVKPDAIFADEYEQQWLENIGNKTILTGEQLRLAKAMQQAVLSDSVAGYYVNYPSRSVEVSYFGMDEDTEMDVRVRPDLEITVDNERIGIDLKTISMGRVRQDVLRARLHREIIDRDYHISAAMYSDVANLNKFFWIFVNKDEGYHWVAVVEASSEEIELGRLEYRKTMQSLKQAYDSGVWPAPITEQYTDNLNDYDLRRLEILSGLV